LTGYYLSPRTWRNLWLLVTSVVFYGWGGPLTLLLLAASIAVNYGFGLWIDRARDTRRAFWVLALAMTTNLIPLTYYKYAGFIVEAIGSVLHPLGYHVSWSFHPTLPIGISFFTFQAMSYVIDVYRRDTAVSRSPIDVALYIAFFPQLIAGPIVRYRDVADQLQSRRETVSAFAEGVERFILGLAKKVLLANSTGALADLIFAIPGDELTAATAWLGLVAYTLQIYFDFSGYSDMAIGLGLMFGIRFLENFNYPYVSRSVTEFWRRWHISLSVWFRDYLYIPLGGNRGAPGRVYLNLLVVFILCGLWHGASWNFLIWGLFHGGFLVGERLGAKRLLDRCPAGVASLYTLLVVSGGWVLFRANDLRHAGEFYRALTGFGRVESLEYHWGMFVDRGTILVLAVGLVGATPWMNVVHRRLKDWLLTESPSFAPQRLLEATIGVGRLAALCGLLLAVTVMLSASTYNPFIYFRF
jgi:alginate O-acetyltransferase complex protein AlgI